MNRCILRAASHRIRTGLPTLLVLMGSTVALRGHAQTPVPDSPSSFQISVQSNLVLVPVVVRDASGNFIRGLAKSDFKILDQKQEQAIVQFDQEDSPAPANQPSSSSTLKALHPLPSRFLVLFFDDRNTPFAELKQARDVADHSLALSFAAGQATEERVAIFNATQRLTDFTADPAEIHAALMKVQRSSPEGAAGRPCPDLSDNQAVQLLEESNITSNAWAEALAEANQCNPTEFPVLGSRSAVITTLRLLAQRIAARARAEAETALQGFARAVQSAAAMPGSRTVLMVSPGFISTDLENRFETLIDAALRRQIVINVLDPAGVSISSRTYDASMHAEAGAHALANLYGVEAERESAVSEILVQFTRGTGGAFFHGNNDLAAGFHLLESPPPRYILGFTPGEMKQDGKLHTLSVSLVSPHRGYTISARRSYVALTSPSTDQELHDSASQAAGNSISGSQPSVAIEEAQEEELMREALNAGKDSAELPAAWQAKALSGSSGTRDITLYGHLDLAAITLTRQGDRNVNRITFIAAAFNQQNKLIAIQKRHATISVADDRIAAAKKEAVDLELTLHLKSGIYRLRTVVCDSAEHRVAASSRFVSIP